jgi:hypothetical protein
VPVTRSLPAVVLALGLAAPSVARAQHARRVAVLPLAAGDADLEIYSVPVAREVSRHLGEALKVEVRALEDAGSVPATIDLVVDGRINKVGEDKIRLEARVRNAAISRTVGSVTAQPRPLVEIDEAARELAAQVAPLISGWRREQPRDPYRLERAATVARSSGGSRVPLVVVLRATGSAADGAIPVQEQASQAAYAFADRLGIDSIATTRELGDVNRVKVANVVRTSRARFGLTLRIEKVRYDFRGVLSARGRARIRLIDRNGEVRFEKVVATDTVVGARGDRHSALVYMVAEQALDIAGPQLRKALEL